MVGKTGVEAPVLWVIVSNGSSIAANWASGLSTLYCHVDFKYKHSLCAEISFLKHRLFINLANMHF